MFYVCSHSAGPAEIAGPIVGYGQWVGTPMVLLAASLLCALGLVGLGLMMRTARGRKGEGSYA